MDAYEIARSVGMREVRERGEEDRDCFASLSSGVASVADRRGDRGMSGVAIGVVGSEVGRDMRLCLL